MYTLEDIADFVASETGVNRGKIEPESRLVEDLGIEGDDFFELEQAFAKRFNVDMSGYLWYFHHGEEGMNIGALLFPPPNLRVESIPVTLTLLLDAANSGEWPLQYPAHELPRRRYDLVANLAFVGVCGLTILFVILRHFGIL